MSSSSRALGSVTLVTGTEEFLAERAVSTVLDAVHSSDPDADVTEIDASELEAGGLAELTSPSLFAAARAVVIRRLQDTPESAAAALSAYVATPAEDVALVLVHNGGQKGKALLDRLRKTTAANEVKCEALKPWDLPKFVAAEARTRGTEVRPEPAAALVGAVGADLRALVAAVEQLGSDCAGEPVTVTVVQRYFGGRAEVKGFAVADAAIDGRRGEALELLRWALINGVAPVLVTSAFATGLRDLARFTHAPSGLRDADLAREIEVAPWKLRALRRQSPGWESAGLASAIQAVAEADADVKGAAEEPEYALERMVFTVAGARTSRDGA